MSDQTFTYFYVPPNGPLVCYPSPNSAQFIPRLAASRRRAEFHDDTLAQATQEINEIMNRVSESNNDPSRTLSLITVPGSHLLLVWAAAVHPLTPQSDRQAIMDELDLVYPE